MTPAERMTKARANLVMSNPFFGSIALRQRMIPDPTCRTMMTNGSAIWYNPEWVKKLITSQVMGVLAHEVLHTACLHSVRMGDRDPAKWNVATDHVVNGILLGSSPPFDLPPCRLHDPQYNGMHAEEVYSRLPTPPKGWGNNPDPGGCGGVMRAAPQPGQTQAEADDAMEQDIKMGIAQAAYAARQRGALSADLARLIGEILEPLVPWKQVLRRFATEATPGDFTWNRPNRRMVDAGLYLPGRVESDPHMQDIVIGVDTSGSIDKEQLTVFSTEIQAIHRELQPRRTIVMYADNQVHGDPVVFGPDDECVLEHRGGGGTDFYPVFEKIEEMQLAPKCTVYLTDGCGTFPDHEPNHPVLWAITTDVVAPFGETLKLTAE